MGKWHCNQGLTRKEGGGGKNLMVNMFLPLLCIQKGGMSRIWGEEGIKPTSPQVILRQSRRGHLHTLVSREKKHNLANVTKLQVSFLPPPPLLLVRGKSPPV